MIEKLLRREIVNVLAINLIGTLRSMQPADLSPVLHC